MTDGVDRGPGLELVLYKASGSVPNPILPGDELMAEILSFFIYKTAQIFGLSHKIVIESNVVIRIKLFN